MDTNQSSHHRVPWNKGKIVGQKAPFKLKEVWAIRIRLQLAGQIRDLAMFDLPRRSDRRASNRHAAKYEASGAVRNHGSDKGRCRRLDPGEASKVG